MANSEYQIIPDNITQTQRDAIEWPVSKDSLLQIKSGPGCGKTTTLVHKIAYLVETGVQPSDILILTMTNRAVDNFKNSLRKLFDNDLVEALNVHTFHAFSHKLLIETNHEYKQKEIIEETGWGLIQKLIDNKKLNKFNLQKITRELKKHEKLTPEQLKTICSNHTISEKAGQKLIQFFSSLKILTHNDVLNDSKSLLRSNPELLNHKITIVDEYQDLYDDLIELIKLVSSNSHLIIAGDTDQSIYGFLGEFNYDDLIGLKKEVHTFELNECFRSSPEILESAHYTLGKELKISNKNDNGFKPIVNIYDNVNDQNDSIALEILRLIEESKSTIKPRDIAILSKTNMELAHMQKALNYYGLKTYKISSNPSWLSGELFHLLEYLKILISTKDSDFATLSTVELLSGVGPVAIRKIYNQYLTENIQVFNVLEKEAKYSKYLQLINKTKQEMDFNDTKSIFEGLLLLGNELGLKSKIFKSIKTSNDKSRLKLQLFEFYENLKLAKNLNDIEIKDEQSEVQLSTAEFFLNNYLDLLPYSAAANESIKLSTIHSSKGLEFPIVFLLDILNIKEKEPKLLYVGMTRPKQLLYLTILKNNPYQFQNVYNMEKFDKNVNFFKNDQYFRLNKPILSSEFLKNYKPLTPPKLFQRSFHSFTRFIK